MSKKFDLNMFFDKRKKIAIHIPTAEQEKQLFSLLKEYDLIADANRSSCFNFFDELTCYDSKGCYGLLENYKKSGYEIYSLDDIRNAVMPDMVKWLIS